MGKTSKPLILLVSDRLAETEPIQKLEAQGHTINRAAEMDLADYDLVLGPNCQLMTVDHLPFLAEAIKRARQLKYGPKGAESDVPEQRAV